MKENRRDYGYERRKMEESSRQAKDQKGNKKSRLLVDFIKERGWMILNGNAK